jgi:hypothetical protein
MAAEGSSLELTVRPAGKSDRAAVLAISRQIWEGHDYVQHFFDRWMRDGGLMIGEMRGRVIGFGKITELAPGELWLEGLRVDPRKGGHGLGRELSRRILHTALDRRPRSLRLATADANHASLAIIRSTAFRHALIYKYFTGIPPAAHAGPEPVRPSPAATLKFLRSHEEQRLGHGLVPYVWLFREANAGHVAELCRNPWVFGFRRGGRLSGLLVMRPHRYNPADLDISFAGGSKPALAAFRAFIGREAARRGSRSVTGMCVGADMAGVLSGFGMKPVTGLKDVLVYEYSL